jgi:hypothetical protein
MTPIAYTSVRSLAAAHRAITHDELWPAAGVRLDSFHADSNPSPPAQGQLEVDRFRRPVARTA